MTAALWAELGLRCVSAAFALAALLAVLEMFRQRRED